MLTESVMPSNHLIFCHPLLLLSIFSSIRVFSNESVLHIRWPQYWSFSSSISPANEYSALISFRTDWLDLLVVKGLSRVFSSMWLVATILKQRNFTKIIFPIQSTWTRNGFSQKPRTWVRKAAPCLGMRKEFISRDSGGLRSLA